MKKIFLITFVLGLIIACKPEKVQSKDILYEKLAKTEEGNLTKIEIPYVIDLDTIYSNNKDVSIKIKNIGKKPLQPLIVKPYCECISIPKYDSLLSPNQEQEITFNIPFEETGNFSKIIYVYGNFYPFMRKVYIEGYRKK